MRAFRGRDNQAGPARRVDRSLPEGPKVGLVPNLDGGKVVAEAANDRLHEITPGGQLGSGGRRRAARSVLAVGVVLERVPGPRRAAGHCEDEPDVWWRSGDEPVEVAELVRVPMSRLWLQSVPANLLPHCIASP